MATTTVKVDGMTCGACTSAVEGAFQGVDGVGDVSVSLMMGRAAIQHDPAILSPAQVARLIEDCGFDATILSTEEKSTSASASIPNGNATQSSTTTLAIEGMTCGACTSAVQSGLTGVEGVNSVDVSLLAERAVVEHDAEKITPEQIAEIIEDRGFGARVVETKTNDGDQPTLTDLIETRRGLMATTVSIGGMTCGACTSSVQSAFSNVEGVVQFNISLLAERAVVVHDPTILGTEKIIALVEDAGFDASIVSSESQEPLPRNTQQLHMHLHGLRDAQSAVALEEALLQRPGVKSASVSQSESLLSVTLDTSMTGIRSVFEFIEEAGYNALLADMDDTNAQLESLAKTKEIQEWRRAFLTSSSFRRSGLRLYLGDLLCLGLTVPVQFGIGRRFYITSYKSLKHKSPTMDVLVMLGTSAAFFYSCFTMLVAIFSEPHRRPSTVFDTCTMLISFITLGRWLENRAKGQTSAALSRLMSLAPSMTTIYEDPIAAQKLADGWTAKSGSSDSQPALPEDTTVNQKMIPTELIQVGDIVVLRPGDKVSADGIVIQGESYMDESMITGEALPIHKKKGSHVIAGTVNGTSALDFKVTRAGKDTQLSQIVKLVQDAQTSRAPIQRMADIVAGYFVPAIIALGLVTFFGWMFLSHVLPRPPQIFTSDDSGGKIMVCLKLCISVIVFACPCALGLSTPTAVMAATKVNHIVFDKTGTLTTGKMSVAQAQIEPQWTANDWRRQLWWLIVGLAEMGSEHPIGRAILAEAKTQSGHPEDGGLPGSVGDFDACVGLGISAVVEPTSSAERVRYNVLLGNVPFLRSRNVLVPASANPEPLETAEDPDGDDSESLAKPNSGSGMTRIHVAIDSQYAGALSLLDSVKDSSKAAVAALHRMGLATSMVTGDTLSTAMSIASAVGIPTSAIYASASPSDKREIVANLQAKGERVAMVGDGINDSPALATAMVGIALASGTDVAMEAADIVLMRPDDLLSVPASLSLSRTVFTRIKLNLLWACVYNVIGLPFAMGIFLPLGVMLPPAAAGAAMALSASRLEKEISSGAFSYGIRTRHAYKNSLWGPIKPPSPYDPAYLLRSVTHGASTLWSSITGKKTAAVREDRGYIPLRAIESSV
ncbi:Copper-transporting ATPase [Penicillium chermesinum]|nr:Copper-transporting ATPase [Penicillium chermesinum]